MINAKVKEFLDIKGFGDRLTEHSETEGWCDVCKGWEEEE